MSDLGGWAKRATARRKFAGREGLVAVQVEVRGASGKVYKSTRYKRPAEAKKLIEAGKAKAVVTAPDPEQVKQAIMDIGQDRATTRDLATHWGVSMDRAYAVASAAEKAGHINSSRAIVGTGKSVDRSSPMARRAGKNLLWELNEDDNPTIPGTTAYKKLYPEG